MLSGVAQAALVDLGNGLVDDTTLVITWIQDANLVKTSCDTDDALWQAFDPEALPVGEQSGHNKTQICASNGTLNWYEAEAWIAVLNAQGYLGHDDWRQPATNPVNGAAYDYNFAYDGSTDDGYNISGPDGVYPGSTGSELAHLHYNSLGNGSRHDTAGNNQGAVVCPASDYCVQNTGPFDNLQSSLYWSGTEYAPNPTAAWLFGTRNGSQGRGEKGSGPLYVWPVRSGQSAVAAAPQSVPTLPMWGLLLMSLALLGLARRRIRLFG